jgi:hypothetical protein
MSRTAWLDELAMLAARYGYGVGPDLGALTLVEAWGLYLLLARIAGGGADVG